MARRSEARVYGTPQVESGSESVLPNSLYFAAFAKRGIFPKQGPFRNLKRLSLAGTEIGDPSLPLIAQLRTLEILSLYDTRVTANGLKSLSALPRLSWLDVPAGLAEAELTDLQRALPKVSLHPRHRDNAVTD